MKYIIQIALLFLSIFMYSQIKVEYDIEIDLSGKFPKPFQHTGVLITSNEGSLFKKFVRNIYEKKEYVREEGSSYIIFDNKKDTLKIIKDYHKNLVFSDEKIMTNVFKVKDSLNQIDWDIKNDTLTVLNYKCYKAYCKYGGREYYAYFTKDIKFSDGPFKFNGLPGLILKLDMINSNSVLSVIAKTVEKMESRLNLSKIKNKDYISYDDFKKLYNLKFKDLERYNQNQDQKINISKGGIELFVDE